MTRGGAGSTACRSGALKASVFGLILILLWWSAPSPVFAHANLQASNPSNGAVVATPPAVLLLGFSQPVQVGTQSVIILAPSGRNVARGPIRENGSLLSVGFSGTAVGTYLVRWSVISYDTHPATGSYVFSVGRVGGIWAGTDSGSSVSAVGLSLQIVARALHNIGYALGFGPFAFLLLALRRRPPSSPPVTQRLFRLAIVGTTALLLAEPLAFLAQMTSLGTGNILDGDVAAAVMASSFGRVLAQRLGAAFLLWALIGLVKTGTQRAVPAILALGGVLAVIDAEASHAADVSPTWFAMGVTGAHVAAMGVWVGGLACLIGVWNLIAPDDRGSLVTHFARVAAASLFVLAVTGAILAWQHLSRLDDLVASGYGRTLLAKVIAVAGAMILAWLGVRAHAARRHWWWRWELTALGLVLVLAGALVSQAPLR